MLAFVAGKRLFSRLVLTTVFALAALARPETAVAQVGSANYSSIVIDAASGNVLSAANPDELRFPASLTKMMTLYLVFEALRDRRVGLNQYVPVSPSASGMEPTKLGLVPGSLITVEQCVLGLVTKSANDAAAALGEMLGGDEDRFAQMMTLRARALGMANTTFRNASGLPDWNQVTTARDMAVLARRLIQDFPSYYHYFSERSFVYAGRRIWNHQALLSSYPGADGLKTGFGLADWHFHDLRHQAAGLLAAAGCDLLVIAAVLGHKKPDMSLHYLTVMESRRQQGEEAWTRLFSPQVSPQVSPPVATQSSRQESTGGIK